MSPGIHITGGEFKGRKLKSPSKGYRPTTAIVKRSFFDSLAAEIENANFLDLFAGAGAIGLEALSRGVGYVCFIEENFSRSDMILKNLEMLGISPDRAEVLPFDYIRALEKLKDRNMKFDIIYTDPPYEEIMPVNILAYVVSSGVLDSEGTMVFETGSKGVRELLHAAPDELYPYRQNIKGDTALVFFRHRGKTAITDS
ncbi:MAG: 16S rRNA (guanine(966)-N(2))-methyltransferase RsmD [bacterium]